MAVSARCTSFSSSSSLSAAEFLFAEPLQNTLGHHGTVGHVRLKQQDHELVAAVTVGGVEVFPDAQLHDLAEVFDDHIPGLVALGIVEFLEMVDIDQEQRDGTVKISAQAGEGLGHFRMKVAHVEKAR